MTIERLIKEATRAASWRGHTLGEWEPGDYWKNLRFAECTVCGMGVAVDPAPPPNGIDISGEAVALDCTR